MASICAHILLIEGRGSDQSFGAGLESKGYEVTTAMTGRQAIRLLDTIEPDVVVFDASNSGTSGVRICKSMRAAAPGIPLIYICARGKTSPPSVRPDVTLVQPFTIRKLVNRINRILPSVDGPVLEFGPLALFIDKRTLVRNQREHRLTPKQAQLLEVLVRRPGQLLSRLELMKMIWNTDFMDDTRTLDVHVRWVREAVEENPSKPRLLRTVRGKGYRLAIPAEDLLPA